MASTAVKSDGSIVFWDNQNAPYVVFEAPVDSGLARVTSVYHNGQAQVALKEDGSIVAWGDQSRRCPD